MFQNFLVKKIAFAIITISLTTTAVISFDFCSFN